MRGLVQEGGRFAQLYVSLCPESHLWPRVKSVLSLVLCKMKRVGGINGLAVISRVFLFVNF